MDIVMTRNTLWQNLMIRIGTEFTVPSDVGIALLRRGLAKDRNAVASPAPIITENPKKKAREMSR